MKNNEEIINSVKKYEEVIKYYFTYYFTFDFLCNQRCNDFLVTFNLCRTAGLLVWNPIDVGNAFSPGSASKVRLENSGFCNFGVWLGANLVVAGRASSPSSLVRSFTIASCTTNISLDGFSSALVAPMMIKMSSFTECPVFRTVNSIFSCTFFCVLNLLTLLVHELWLRMLM